MGGRVVLQEKHHYKTYFSFVIMSYDTWAAKEMVYN